MSYTKSTIYFFLCVILILLCPVMANEIDAGTDRAKFGMAQSLLNLSRFDEADPILKELYEKYPDNKEIVSAYVRSLGYGSNPEKAIELLEKLQDKYPDDIYITQTYASILESSGNLKKARDKYIVLYKRDESDSKIILKLADISGWLKDYETAILYYEKALASDPESISIKTSLADMHYFSKNYIKAANAYSEIPYSEFTEQRRINLGYAYLKTGETDKAIGSFRKIVEAYPDKLEYRIALIDALVVSQDKEALENELKQVLAKWPNETRLSLRMVELLASRKDYDAAIEKCKDILERQPQNTEAHLWLARVLSWDSRYDESLKAYDDIITSAPDLIVARKEKARVLGWTRKYNESIEEYEKAIEIDPTDKALLYEMRSKHDFYNLYDISGIRNYELWLGETPEDLEGLYDLGQIYSRQRKWSKAKEVYAKVLDISPHHFRAKQALNKVAIYSEKTKLTAGFEYVEADSTGRTMDKRYWNTYASVEKPLNESWNVRLRQDNTWYSYKDHEQIYQQGVSTVLDYHDNPELWASIKYRHNMYPDDNGLRHTFGGLVGFQISDPMALTFSHDRQQIIDNSTVFKDHLFSDNYKVMNRYRFNRWTTAGVDYTYSNYSDDNNRHMYGFEIDHYLWLEPKSLKISYRYEEYKFDRTDLDYFSPRSFHYNKLGLEFRHFLNSEELFWGANDTYYTLRYETTFDVKDNIGHRLYFDFHHDWNDNCSSHLEWSKMIYESSEVYAENRLMFYTSIYF